MSEYLQKTKAKIEAYCQLKDLELSEIVEDAGISAKNLKRPGVQKVLGMARKKKVDAIVVSGDNATQYYNETKRMEDDLVKAGVPKKYIAGDHAGFRTLDSIVRAEALFDLKDYIIISQKFHLERALFIAKAKGQKVIGFAAKDKEGTKAAKKMAYREYLARVKAFLDVYILQTEPRFYGKKVKVNYKK